MLVVEIPKSLSYEAWDLLEREIDARNAALPDVMQVKKVWYTHDPLLSPTDFSIRRDRLLREIDAGRVRLFDRASATEVDAAECADVRARIRALFSEILGIPEEEIAGDAHFMMDLGGSSLDYYALIGELDRTFDVKLPYESENFAYSLDDFERIIKELLKAHV